MVVYAVQVKISKSCDIIFLVINFLLFAISFRNRTSELLKIFIPILSWILREKRLKFKNADFTFETGQKIMIAVRTFNSFFCVNVILLAHMDV